MRRGWQCALVALLLVGGGVCSSSPKAASTPGAADDLAALIITDVPSGFVVQPDNVGDTGPSDLAKAVRDAEDPAAEGILRTAGFVRGYQRLWVGPGDAQIIVFLYEFATDAGARQYWTQVTANPSADWAPFSVDGLPQDSTTGIQSYTADFAMSAVDFTKGVFAVSIVCSANTIDGLQARVSALAWDQFGRL